MFGLQVQEVIKSGSQRGKPSAMHKRQRTATDHEPGVWKGHTDLQSPTTASAFYLRWEGTVERDSSLFHVDVHADVQTDANEYESHRSNDTGHETALEEDAFLPFPCHIQHKHCRENGTQRRVKHLWRWSAYSKEQRGSVSCGTAPGWRDDSKHTPVCKRHSHIVYL